MLALMGESNVMEMTWLSGTLTAPLAGVFETTRGGVLSTVRKYQV